MGPAAVSGSNGPSTGAAETSTRLGSDLPPQVVDGMFEDVIAECLEDVPEPSVVLATDGSVVPNIPKSGWGYVIRDSCGNLRVGHGGCKMLLSSMHAEIEAVSRGLNIMREVAPDNVWAV